MCPVCIASVALLASSATSTGGVTALFVKNFAPGTVRRKSNRKQK